MGWGLCGVLSDAGPEMSSVSVAPWRKNQSSVLFSEAIKISFDVEPSGSRLNRKVSFDRSSGSCETVMKQRCRRISSPTFLMSTSSSMI